jgi:hypothetical protein
MTAVDPNTQPVPEPEAPAGTAPEDAPQDVNAPPEGVDPAEWQKFQEFTRRDAAATTAEQSGSKSPQVEGALSDFDYSAAKERGGFYADEVFDSGDVTIGDMTVSRAALAVTDPEAPDAIRAQAAARLDLAVRGHVAWRDSRPVEEQIAMRDRPVISFAPEGGE